MLNRFNCNGAPLFDLGRGLFGIEVDGRSFGENRDNPSSPDLGGLLDNVVHGLAFGYRLEEGERTWWSGMAPFLLHHQGGGMALDLIDPADQFQTGAIEYDGGIARLETKGSAA